MPAAPVPNFSEFKMIRKEAISESPYTGSRQVVAHQGAYWQATLIYPKMTRAKAAAWIVFFLELQGAIGTFYLADPDGNIQGSGAGTPVVAAGGFAGNLLSVATSGWTASQTDVLKAGDWISFSNYEYKRVLADVDSDGAGLATVYFEPVMRNTVAAATAIACSTAKGKFMLADPSVSWTSDHLIHYGFSLVALEVIA